MPTKVDIESVSQVKKVSVPTRLGLVSFFNDCSSEVISRALPLFLTTSLGFSPAFVGLVEGVSETISILLKGISGWISDHLPSRKPLVILGYSLSICSRFLLFLAQMPLVFGLSRVLDRTGKGLRSAPRDAMIADATVQGVAGRDFSITRFLDTLGAVSGILLVLVLGIGNTPMDRVQFRQIVLLALPFGVVSLLVLVFWVPPITRVKKVGRKLSWHIPKQVRGYLAIVFLFALANSSDAFLILRAQELGLSFRETLFILLAFNSVAALLAIPAGVLSDKFGRVRFLSAGWMVYGLCYLAMGLFASKVLFVTAMLAYGAFYGFTEGVEKALLSDLLPAESKGAGFGSLQLILGLAALPASLTTGMLMSAWGSQVAFMTCGAIALLSSGILVVWARVR